MPPPSRLQRSRGLEQAPLEDLLSILLRQFRRPFAAHGFTLTDADADALAHTVMQHTDHPLHDSIQNSLRTLITESETVLVGWNLTFETALDTAMDAIPGWESTAEFLDLANDKSNAELRIAAATTLTAAMGDLTAVHRLLFLAERTLNDPDPDPDSVIATRVLRWLSDTENMDGNGWFEKARAWVERHSSTP